VLTSDANLYLVSIERKENGKLQTNIESTVNLEAYKNEFRTAIGYGSLVYEPESS